MSLAYKFNGFIAKYYSIHNELCHIDFRYNVMDEEEIQGEEDGVSGMDGDVKV